MWHLILFFNVIQINQNLISILLGQGPAYSRLGKFYCDSSEIISTVYGRLQKMKIIFQYAGIGLNDIYLAVSILEAENICKKTYALIYVPLFL